MKNQRPTDSQTFDNFIVTQSNEKAYAACIDLVDNPEGKFVVLYGANSCGKTHLLNAVKRAFMEKSPNARINTRNYEDLIAQYIIAIHKDETDFFIEKLIETDLLILDNMQFVAGKCATQDEITDWINRMLSARKTVIVAFDRPIKYYNNLINGIVESDNIKRTVVEVKRPNYSLRKQYLDYILRECPVALPFIVRRYIALSRRLPFSAISGFIHKCCLLEKQKGQALSILEIKKCLGAYMHKEVHV